MGIIFNKSKHTLVLSDLHLTIAEPDHGKRSLWKKFNRKDYFIDQPFANLLKKATQQIKKEIELVLAGDIFDFDSVTEIPETDDFHPSWLEKKRGLNSEEAKSFFKIKRIIESHPVFFQALNDFVQAGNKIIFVIGNHDLELHWPSVKEEILNTLSLAKNNTSVRFCPWFYISNSDTLIEHGNQYDSYCSIADPINPFYHHLKNAFIKLPFGNLVHRYMINGMGIFNPHVDTTYLLSFGGYLKFYLNTVRTQPLLLIAWFFGAVATSFIALRDRLMPHIKNPLTLEDRYKEISQTANAEPRMVRALRELHLRPVTWNIFKIMRVLWLDRALLFFILVYCAFQVVALMHIIWEVSFLWTFPVFFLFMPFFLMYIHKIEVIRPATKVSISRKIIKLATEITKTSRLVCGHVHAPEHKFVDGIEYLNSGYWSPSFKDPNCTVFEKNKTFVWIKPGSKNRDAMILFWDDCKDSDNVFI